MLLLPALVWVAGVKDQMCIQGTQLLMPQPQLNAQGVNLIHSLSKGLQVPVLAQQEQQPHCPGSCGLPHVSVPSCHRPHTPSLAGPGLVAVVGSARGSVGESCVHSQHPGLASLTGSRAAERPTGSARARPGKDPLAPGSGLGRRSLESPQSVPCSSLDQNERSSRPLRVRTTKSTWVTEIASVWG